MKKSTPFKASRGFTLVELMVVVAIIAVLMGIVSPAVTGTKSQSLEGQVQSDGKATQTALENFNNKAAKSGAFPEFALDDAIAANQAYKDVLQVGSTVPTEPGANVTLIAKDGTVSHLSDKVTKFGTTSQVFARAIVAFSATTDVYDTDGSVKQVRFVPGFLSKEPSSIILKGDETKDLGIINNKYEEYLWVALVNAPGTSQEGRTVQIFRMSGATCTGPDGNSTCDNLNDSVTSLTYTQMY